MKRYLLFLMSAAIILLFSCTKEKNEEKSDVVIKTANVLSLSAENGKEYSFLSRPFRTSELSFRVGGPIDRFDVYVGNYYKRGSLIAEIDPRDFRIRKERAQAIYCQAKAEFERIQKLYWKNNVSASLYERTKADYSAAKVAFDVASYELEDARLLAPFNGYVSEVYIEKFQEVKATQPVLSLIDIDRLKIEIYVTQEVAYAARSLDSLQIRFDAQPDTVYHARVMEISKGTTRNNLSYLLTALLPNPDGKLLAGMSGKAFFDLPPVVSERAQVVIPQAALCHRPTVGDYVWVVNETNSVVNLRKVKTADLLPGGRVTILAGLKPHEKIATSGLRFLSDGMQITVSSKKN